MLDKFASLFDQMTSMLLNYETIAVGFFFYHDIAVGLKLQSIRISYNVDCHFDFEFSLLTGILVHLVFIVGCLFGLCFWT